MKNWCVYIFAFVPVNRAVILFFCFRSPLSRENTMCSPCAALYIYGLFVIH